ncbi:MAG: hypothetical protein [Bacteriophage sp.]|nr:MAG: hypothetical protein [Bacteriophage sp.]
MQINEYVVTVGNTPYYVYGPTIIEAVRDALDYFWLDYGVAGKVSTVEVI